MLQYSAKAGEEDYQSASKLKSDRQPALSCTGKVVRILLTEDIKRLEK